MKEYKASEREREEKDILVNREDKKSSRKLELENDMLICC